MAKKEPKEKRIDDILWAAVDVFLEKGYEGASMDAIAQRAGMSKGGLYHHFKSKDMILIFANQHLSEPIEQLALKACEYESAADGLSFYIQNYLEYWAGHEKELVFFFLSMAKALSEPELYHYYQSYTQETIRFYEGLYQKGVAQGELEVMNPKGEALTLMSALDGISSYLFMDKTLTVDEVTDYFIKKYVASVRVKR